jgi:efflux transporter, outer membrane factor (OMF) lipoprotein, NodT family
MKKAIFVIGIGALILNSCAFYAKPTNVSIKYPSAFKEKLSKYEQAYTPKDQNLYKHWWKTFNDKTLDYYVDLALKNNPNYLIALKNIELSKAYVLENSSVLFPSFNLNASGTKQKLSRRTPTGKFFSIAPYTTYNLSVSASYEIDLFAKALNAYRYYKENVKISKEEAKAIKNALIMNTVNNYYQIVENAHYIKLLEKEINIAKKNLELAKTNYKAGLTSYQNVDQAKSSLLNLEQTLETYKAQRKVLVNAFAYLLGEYPEDFKFSIYGTLPKDFAIPKAIPSTVLTTRPDVKEAMYNVISSAYQKKVALANFFPSFDLTGSYGFQSQQLNNLVTQPSISWNFGLDILTPILNWNQNLGLYKASKVALAQSILNYRQTVLNAFKEVDDAIAQYKTDDINYKSLKKSYQTTLDQYRIALANYKAGLTPYSNLLTYKTNLIESKKALLNQKLKLIQDISSLYNVLGY